MNVLFSSLAALSVLAAGVGAAASAQSSDPLETFLSGTPDDVWVTIDPENVLVMELPSGPVYIELRPDLAPKHVERMKTLTRRGFYDGLLFHRVIDGFMAQGGDPTATGTGGSDLPNMPGEFYHNAADIRNAAIIGRDDRAAQVGFVGSVPVGTQAPTLPGLLAGEEGYALWGLHCQGVMSMARANDPDSANSQFFLLFGDSRDNLDQGYTVWGRVVSGYRNARRINRGEPPVRPTPIVRMRLLADIPADEQVTVSYLDPGSDTFLDYANRTGARTEDGYIEDTCGLQVPAKIDGELDL